MRRKCSRHCFVYRTPCYANPPPRPGARRCATEGGCYCPRLPPTSRSSTRRTCRRKPSATSSGCSCSPSNKSEQTCCYPLVVREPDPPPRRRLERKSCCCPKEPRIEQPPSCCSCAAYDAGPVSQVMARPQPPAYYPPQPPPGQVAPFQPAIQSINNCIEAPSDPYYNHTMQPQIGNPMGNFDLNRFDRDHAGIGGTTGRRRNVSIRTCVDYDYDPGTTYQAQAPPPPPSAYPYPYPPPPSPHIFPHQPNPCPCPHPQFMPTQRNCKRRPSITDRSDSVRYTPCPHRRAG
ncbi:leucine-rich repeat extensin-like protein 2 [Drosophila busckii]|uniref:leucine-rich repeat extensin-like protein 2 n=1 Tax=Drosophila busckii TaxID=30019 RepID=UPI00083F0554|nr:leucine-rich repeat extensin-like protein 2 [Drosophila busckii]